MKNFNTKTISQVKSLFGEGEADAVLFGVEDGVVFADEGVTQDPERTGRNVNTDETAQTDALTELADLQNTANYRTTFQNTGKFNKRNCSLNFYLDDIVGSFQGESLAADVHCQIGQGRDFVARDGVLKFNSQIQIFDSPPVKKCYYLSVDDGSGANGLLQLGNGGLRASHQRGAGVSDRLKFTSSSYSTIYQLSEDSKIGRQLRPLLGGQLNGERKIEALTKLYKLNFSL